ncbi:MAG: choice-of-anchor W domain-containing protein [Pleurocapsa sp.]
MNKNLFKSVIFGSTFAALALVARSAVARSASAITLTPVTEAFAFDPANGWTIDATAQGRAGVLGAGDWELGGFNDTIPGGATFSQAQWVWRDEEEVSWLLEVDQITNLATFNMWTNPSEIATINLGPSSGFNGFGIVTSSDGRNSTIVEPGTEISLRVNQINGLALGTQAFTTNAIAPSGGVDKEVNYFALSEVSYSLAGTLFMDWNTINPQAKRARSRVQFEVKIFDRPEESQSVPEPSALLGLLSLGGVGLIKKRI